MSRMNDKPTDPTGPAATCSTCGLALPMAGGVAMQSACLKCSQASKPKKSPKKGDADHDDNEDGDEEE